MTTIEKLHAYKTALERWKRKTKDKPEPEPSPALFELKADDPYAVNIRKMVFKNVVKIPVRKLEVKIPMRII